MAKSMGDRSVPRCSLPDLPTLVSPFHAEPSHPFASDGSESEWSKLKGARGGVWSSLANYRESAPGMDLGTNSHEHGRANWIPTSFGRSKRTVFATIQPISGV